MMIYTRTYTNIMDKRIDKTGSSNALSNFIEKAL